MKFFPTCKKNNNSNKSVMPALPNTSNTWIQTSFVPRQDITNPSAVANSYKLEVAKPLPTLKSNQVLIKVARTTINPNDLLHLSGAYGPTAKIPLPRPGGFEAAGVVVKSTASPRYLFPQEGARVAFFADKGGAFGDYVVAEAINVFPIDDSVSFERAACSIANPITVIVMVDEIKAKGHKIFVSTAAAGSCGKLLLKYATSQGLDVINIVRKQSQVDMLKNELKAKYVLNSTSPTFPEDLTKLMKDTKCTFAYDCLSGNMPNTLLRAGPPGTTVSVYGTLGSDDMPIEMFALTEGRRVEIFLIAESMERMWLWNKLRVINKVQQLMKEDNDSTTTKVAKAYALTDLPQALADYAGDNKSAGKIQIIGNEGM